MVVRNVVAPASQPEPVSRLKSATRERPVRRYSEVFRLRAEGEGFVVEVDNDRM